MNTARQHTAVSIEDLIRQRPLIISGPCSIESEDQLIDTALQLSKYPVNVLRGGVWKPRTRPGNFEGIGEKALKWLVKAKQITGLPVMVEVGTARHVEAVLKHDIDMVWIGARTVTNPFAVQEIADALEGSNLPVMVKNPLSPDLQLWLGAIERFQRAGIKNIIAIHRGFSTQSDSVYRNEPLWDLPAQLRRELPDVPMICDPSHMSGERHYLKELIFKASTLDYAGYMIESHHDPDVALSDKNQQITPDDLNQLLNDTGVLDMHSAKGQLKLDTLRSEINDIDEQLIALLKKRFTICKRIAKVKADHQINVLQNQRWEEILDSRIKIAQEKNVSTNLVKDLLKLIHEESLRIQKQLIESD